MKKLLFVLMICFTASGSFAQQAGYVEETITRPTVQKERKLLCGTQDKPVRIAGFMNYPPFGWKEMIKDENGEDAPVYLGIGMELFQRFAKEYDLKYRYTNLLNYNEAIYAMRIGYFDLLVTDFYNSDPYSQVQYIYPGYILNPIVIVSLKPTSDTQTVPQTLDDLKGKTGYARYEENIYRLFHNQIPSDITIKQVTGAKRAFYGLLKKEVDFLLMSQYAFETEVRRFKIADYVTYSSKPVFTPYVFMSYMPNNQCARFIKKALENKVKEYAADEQGIRSVLSRQLITWENKFASEPSLMFETGVPAEEVEEKAADIDAWLKEQQTKQEQTQNTPSDKDNQSTPTAASASASAATSSAPSK